MDTGYPEIPDIKSSPRSSPGLPESVSSRATGILNFEPDTVRDHATDRQSPKYLKALEQRNNSNRQAAQVLKHQLRKRTVPRPPQDTESLPDVGQLKLDSTPSVTSATRFREDMSKPITFSGKPRQLEPCLTYVQVRCIAENITTGQQKAGVLASLFRGPALSWLTTSLKLTPTILQDFDELVTQLRSTFGTTPQAQKLQAANAITSLRQKGSVQDYEQRFSVLAAEAELTPEIQAALFAKGLKPKIREALIVSDAADTYDEIAREAKRLDAEFYFAGVSRSQARSNKGGKHPTRGKDGKFKAHSPIKSEPDY
jgi:hypothetical protein